MRVPRLYVDRTLHGQKRIRLERQASEHVSRVLRLRPGAALILFDGHGGQYQGVLEQCSRRDAVVSVGDFEAVDVESGLDLILAQSISKGDRMDYTIQKAVELGVSRICPLVTERTVVHLQGDRLMRRMQHWQSIIIHACQQCGRNILPVLESVRTLQEFVGIAEGVRLVLNHRAGVTLRNIESPPDRLTLLIGPEGGLSEAEIDQVQAAGFTGIQMGARVMRTETAALAAISAIQTLWGDMA